MEEFYIQEAAFIWRGVMNHSDAEGSERMRSRAIVLSS